MDAQRSSALECNCLALRQAARHVTQFYDRHLGEAGLRATQFSILKKIHRLGRTTINALAAEMVMDRTTLGRNILPLEREGLIVIEQAPSDRRIRALRLTPAGKRRLTRALQLWAEAQAQFEASFGGKRSAQLRSILRSVVASPLEKRA